MSNEDVVRFWKDPDFRSRLTPEERAAFPEHPSGPCALGDDAVADVEGGSFGWLTSIVCWTLSQSCIVSCYDCTVGTECGYGSAKVCSCCPEYCI